MYVIIAPIQIKDGHKDEFIEALLEDARGSVNDEPGCLRFDVIQDSSDANRVWLYEVYVDEAAFQAHTQAPHFGQMAGYGGRLARPGTHRRRAGQPQHMAPRRRVEVIAQRPG